MKRQKMVRTAAAAATGEKEKERNREKGRGSTIKLANLHILQAEQMDKKMTAKSHTQKSKYDHTSLLLGSRSSAKDLYARVCGQCPRCTAVDLDRALLPTTGRQKQQLSQQ